MPPLLCRVCFLFPFSLQGFCFFVSLSAASAAGWVARRLCGVARRGFVWLGSALSSSAARFLPPRWWWLGVRDEARRDEAWRGKMRRDEALFTGRGEARCEARCEMRRDLARLPDGWMVGGWIATGGCWMQMDCRGGWMAGCVNGCWRGRDARLAGETRVLWDADDTITLCTLRRAPARTGTCACCADWRTKECSGLASKCFMNASFADLASTTIMNASFADLASTTANFFSAATC